MCYHHRAMPHKGQKSISCDGKRYTFPYRLYDCPYHGYFIWRGNRHELFDFSKLKHRAKVEPLPAGAPSPTLADYLIVEMKCTECGNEWSQYDKTWLYDDKYVICPKCGAKIVKEEAVKDRNLKVEMYGEVDENTEMKRKDQWYFGKKGQYRWIVEKILHKKWKGMPSDADTYLKGLSDEERKKLWEQWEKEAKEYIEGLKRKGLIY